MSDVIKNSEGWFWPKNDGLKNPQDSCWHYMKTHADVPKKIAAHVVERKVVVQAGGNCGYYVKQYAELFEIVYTFEPEPLNFYCLTLNVTDRNVIKLQGCLGDSHQTVGLENDSPDIGATHVAGLGPVPTFKIDDLALSRCDLIHLDIEGYELFALKGAEQTIKRFRPVIALEFYSDWAARYHTTLADIEDFLLALSYKYVTEEQGDKIYKFVD